MKDLDALLDAYRSHAGATVAALVGRDGLLIERADAGEIGLAPGSDPDLPLAGAEATDLFTVADRLLMDAFGAGEAQECWLAGRDAALHLARLGGGAFAVLRLPAGTEPSRARQALDAARADLETGLS